MGGCTPTVSARASAIIAPTVQLARRSSPTPRPNSALLRCYESKRHKRRRRAVFERAERAACDAIILHPSAPSLEGFKELPGDLSTPHTQGILLIDDEAREPVIRQLASGRARPPIASSPWMRCPHLRSSSTAGSARLPCMRCLSSSSYYITANLSLVPQLNRLLMCRLLRRLTIDCPGAWRVQTKALIVTLKDQLFSRGTTGLGTLVLLLRERSSLRTASSGSNTNNV